MPYTSDQYLHSLVKAIQEYQDDNLLSYKDISLKAWLNHGMIKKIINWKTRPSMTTLHKLKKIWIKVPKPNRD